MLPYQRKISLLLALCLTLVVAASFGVAYFISLHSYDYVAFIGILILPLFFIVFTQIKIDEGYVTIVKYLLLGSIKRKYELNKHNIKAIGRREEISQLDESYTYDPDEGSFVTLLSPIKDAIQIVTWIKYQDQHGLIRVFSVRLDEKEYQLIRKSLHFTAEIDSTNPSS